MDAIFKHYNICDDVAEIICQKVHKGHQEVINNHISVIVNWNEDFDYWRFHNVRVPSSELLKSTTHLKYNNRVMLVEVMDFIKKRSSYNKETSNSLMSNEDYMKYIWSGKKVFSVDSITRFPYFIVFCVKKCRQYTTLRNPDIQLRIVAARTLIHPMRMIPNIIQFVEKQHDLALMLARACNVFKTLPESEVINPLTMNFLINIKTPNRINPYSKYKITKKTLIQFLNQNGDSRKLTNKSKPELWKMAIKV
jgi:hypothetical protein